jgi:hypothetical protein
MSARFETPAERNSIPMKFYVLHSQHNGETTLAEYEDEGELDRWLTRWQLKGRVGDGPVMRTLRSTLLTNEVPPRVRLASGVQDFEMDGGTAIIFKGGIHMPEHMQPVHDGPGPKEEEKPDLLEGEDVYFAFEYDGDFEMNIFLTRDDLLAHIEKVRKQVDEDTDGEDSLKFVDGAPADKNYFVDECQMLIIKGRLIVPKPKKVVEAFDVE